MGPETAKINTFHGCTKGVSFTEIGHCHKCQFQHVWKWSWPEITIDVLVSSLHAGFRGSGGQQSSTLPPAGGAAAGRKVALADGKVLYCPLQLLQRVESTFPPSGINFSSNLYWQNLEK
jgi:hypothetical protein